MSSNLHRSRQPIPRSPNSVAAAATRRHFLGAGLFGIGGLAANWLLQQEAARAESQTPTKPLLETPSFDLRPKSPPSPARADAMISIFMGGGPSHIDMFDPKPEMAQFDGKLFPRDNIDYDNAGGASKVVMASPFQYRKCGQSGMELSELLPHSQQIVDEITLVRSMNLPGIRNHVAGMRAMNTGRGRGDSLPALGSWLTYGLGSVAEDLPAFVAITTYSPPPGSPYWSSGFLPSIYQGTVVRSTEPRILNLDPPPEIAGQPQRNNLQLLDRLNRIHLENRPGELELAARIENYELAARMQTSAKQALNIGEETKATHQMYGIHEEGIDRRFAESCLIARRLVERGVRFVQLWYYGWDMHEKINKELPRKCRATDKPSAALVKDLKQRGLLDRTLVHWGGEMGRLPVIQYRGENAEPGRDHNTDGFSMWLAGGGVKGGHVHGATDDFGHKAIEDPVNHVDYHMTLLHLFGIDADRLTYRHNGRDRTLPDGQSGRVITQLLA